MTKDEIIEMAKLVVGNYEHAQYWPFFTEELEHFAKLVAAKAVEREREACAVAGFHACLSQDDAVRVRDTIRARGQQ